MRKARVRTKDPMKQIQKIFRERGTKALEIAKKEILQEKIECAEIREALKYFMTKYWRDLARPSLMSLVCEAVEGNPELTIPIAVPMILISGAIDIHDDIIDQSKTKNGRPTVYGKYGKDVALLVGDALLFKGLTLLNKAWKKDVPNKKMRIIMGIVENMFFELGDAEALELRFRGNLDVSPEEYLNVLRKKAADVEAHTRISAILGDASTKRIEALGEYGRILGMLILLRDDLIDFFDGDENCSRIKNESLPLPLLYGLQHSRIKDKLKDILLKKTLTKKDAEVICETVQKTGVLQKYAKLMSELAEDAISKSRKENIKNENLEILLKATFSSLTEAEPVQDA